MSYDQLLQDAKAQYHKALHVNDLQTASHYHQQMRQIQHEIDNQNLMLNSMYQMKPGGVVFSDATNFTMVGTPDDEGRWKRERELETKRLSKVFIHHAKLFAERYPNWTVTPDPKNPFNNVVLEHKNGKYRIETGPHDNGLFAYNTETEPQRRTTSFIKKFGIPHNVFKISPIEVGRNEFYGWSVGMEDAPDWVRE